MELGQLTKKEQVLNWLKKHLFAMIIGTMILAYILSMLLPVLWAFWTSFRTYRGFLEAPFGQAGKLTFDNYVTVFNEMKITSMASDGGRRVIYIEEMLTNSLLMSFILPIASIIPACTVGYVMAKYDFKFNKVLMGTIIMLMTLPSVGGVAGEIAILKLIGLYDSFFGLVALKFFFTGSWTLVYLSAFEGISWDYAEAVFLDGGGHFTAFFKVMVPFTLPFHTTYYIMLMIGNWASYGYTLYYTPSIVNFAYGLYWAKFAIPKLQRETVYFASSFLLVIPVAATFLIFSDKMMGDGIRLGGLKG